MKTYLDLTDAQYKHLVELIAQELARHQAFREEVAIELAEDCTLEDYERWLEEAGAEKVV